MISRIIIIIFTVIISLNLSGQLPKREFRAVWVATVENIDWPSRRGLNTYEQKAEILKILDHHKNNGINAVIFQVRPSSDALYESNLEPWSMYLSGIQGLAPDPFYDPLEYWIEEAHKRGMELHAWFNPYRVKQNLKDSLAEDHIINKHPDWSWVYGNRLYFAPDNPDVWEFVKQVVIDVVKNYDVDAIHFDDYFYPYKIAGEDLPDREAFRQRGGNFYPDHIEEWRRHNVDTIIQILSSAIKETKPWVKFGISPFGVWRNRDQDPLGSETGAGTTNYDVLYADVIRWQQKGWIDYLMPQLYWRDDHPVADFSTLAYWWSDFNFGRAMYYGLAPYRIDNNSEHRLWRKEKYFYRKIELIRSIPEVDGFGFYSSKHFFRDDLESFARKLNKKYLCRPALIPPMTWIDNTLPDFPVNIKAHDNRIEWEINPCADPMNEPRFFVIYRYDINTKRCLKDPEKIISVTGEKYISFPDEIPEGIYRISSLDRLNNESQLSEKIIIEHKGWLKKIISYTYLKKHEVQLEMEKALEECCQLAGAVLSSAVKGIDQRVKGFSDKAIFMSFGNSNN